MRPSPSALLAAARVAEGGAPLSDEEALSLAHPGDALPTILEAARATRDRFFGATLTYSPKVFLPVTNLCRNRCDYCAFRRSPGDEGAWTMSPAEIGAWLDRARAQGCAEALLCLGDKPESAFGAYRATLASFGQGSTVSYLGWAARAALERGLLPHTNAGVLTREEIAELKPVNVSMGLMLENSSPRLAERGMAHFKAPDKRPERRLAMLVDAGLEKVPFTTGILVGIGETPEERVESLLAIRRIHEAHGHIQEIIVQRFRAHASTVMASAPEPTDDEVSHAIALGRLIFGASLSVQAPPNLSPGGAEALIAAGIDDFGGISPVSPDYINRRLAWPHIARLGDACASAGFHLAPRLSIYPRYVDRPGFLDASLRGHVEAAARRLAEPRNADEARNVQESHA